MGVRGKGFVLIEKSKVPMNWQDPTDERRVILGVMKLPAKSKGPSVPPLFMNPGVGIPSENILVVLEQHSLTLP